MSPPAVELLEVEKVYRDFWGRARVQALEPLTLTIEPGEILALLGPNGAGKSTTIKLILGLLFPSRGRALVYGGSPRLAANRRRLGYLPEETKLHAFLDARETLDLFGRLHGLDRKQRRLRSEQLIEMVGLLGNERRPVGEYSKGMARRIGLAVALAGDPDLLILDEPTSGLDPLGTRDIKDLLEELRGRGRTVLLTSHLLDDVEDVADRCAILYGGKLRRLGRTRDLLAQRGRIRLELDRPPEVSPRDVAVSLGRAVPGAGRIEVSTPADRLEDLFRRVVEEAESDSLETAGAKRGGAVAGFLVGEERRPIAPVPPPERPAAEEPVDVVDLDAEAAAAGPRIESLADLAPAAPIEAEAAPAPGEDVLGRLLGRTPAQVGPASASSSGDSTASEGRTSVPSAEIAEIAEVAKTENPTLQRLLGQAPSQAPPSSASSAISALNTPVPTAESAEPPEPTPTVSDQGRDVLDRLLRSKKPTP